MAETDETYSAKQIANRIGTDAKTFRKWLRSTASPYQAVGQGQRYDFPKADLPKIAKQFHAWKDRSRKLPPVNGRSTTIPEAKKLNKTEFEAELASRSAARDKEYGTIDGEEPTPEELAELENLDLEDLELD